MAFHIQKPSVMIPGRTVYTQEHSPGLMTLGQEDMGTSTTPTNLMDNPDGTNGGWTGATVVEE